jgi:DNA-binding transcriptional ArsR family regulator
VHTAPVDAVFHALAHPARRAIISRLGRGSATVSELAAPSGMALPSFTQHLQVLEGSGIVRSTKRGRVRTYQLGPEPLSAAEAWLAEQRDLWNKRLDQLDALLLSPDPLESP